MTPDGISTKDWQRVRRLAIDIANAVTREDDVLSARRTYEMFKTLMRLERKYGEKPSILSTRADYVADEGRGLALLEKAFALASKAEDHKNKTYIASSIAERLMEAKDHRRARLWTRRLGECLRTHYDPDESKVYRRLQRKLKIG